jgi:hypothetical protein
MTEIDGSSNLNCTLGVDFGNCDSCKRTLEAPFYQYYRNGDSGEYCRSGAIASKDEQGRYDFLGLCKHGMNCEFEEMLYVKKETLCLECYEGMETKVNAIQLHLNPDTTNAALENYLSTLPDPGDYPRFERGLLYCLADIYESIRDDLNIAFAKEDVKFDKYAQERLDNLMDNCITEKGRRYPNEEELARWLGDVSHCKIFDMRDLNYIQADVIRRFVVIVHLPNHRTYIDGVWLPFYLPVKGIWIRSDRLL